MQKCWPMWFQITHLPQKGTCFRKLTNITCLPIEPHHSTAFQTNLYTRLHNSGSNWAQIVHFSQEIVSGKIDYYFSVLAVFYIATTIKKSQRANHRCIILAQIGLGPVHQKGIYWKSWRTLHWSFISHHATYFQNNPETADHMVA